MEASRAIVILDTVAMELLVQIMTNVWTSLAIQTPLVPIMLEATPAHAIVDSLVTEQHVLTRTNATTNHVTEMRPVPTFLMAEDTVALAILVLKAMELLVPTRTNVTIIRVMQTLTVPTNLLVWVTAVPANQDTLVTAHIALMWMSVMEVIIVTLMQRVQITMEASRANVILDTVAMELLVQTSTNVWTILVMQMPRVPTMLEATPAHVIVDSLVTEQLVLTRTNVTTLHVMLTLNAPTNLTAWDTVVPVT
jgi:hypothetical protein